MPQRRPVLWLRTALAYAFAVGFGALGSWLGVPLAWILGPLFAAALLSISGFEFFAPRPLRQAGQVVIGAAIGLNVTAAVAARILLWAPAVVITALVAVVVSATLSVALARLAQIDQKTAFFAMMPGGLAEMGNIGASVGARAEPIAITQALRVALVVFLIPPLLFAADGHIPVPPPQSDDLAPFALCLVLFVGAASGLAAGKLRLNNPWAIGSLIGTACLTVSGVVEGHVPRPIFFAGQLVLGVAIGVLFRRELILQLPRLASVGALFVAIALLIMAGVALILSTITGLDLATAILAASPGGMAEMSSTAQLLHLSAALVAVFHVGRAVLVNAFATHYWNLLFRLGFFEAIQRLGANLKRAFF